MKRTGVRKLAISRETLRRLTAVDLAQVAGGRLTCCTYGYSGCQGEPQTEDCGPTKESIHCDSNCCQ